MRVVQLVLIGAVACGGAPSPSPSPTAPASIDFVCGPWLAVGMDEPIGPSGLTGRKAFAAIAGRHQLEGPSVTGDPDEPGLLTVDVVSGPGRILLSSGPVAPLGSCGARMEVVASARTPDGAIDARFDRATLFL